MLQYLILKITFYYLVKSLLSLTVTKLNDFFIKKNPYSNHWSRPLKCHIKSTYHKKSLRRTFQKLTAEMNTQFVANISVFYLLFRFEEV